MKKKCYDQSLAGLIIKAVSTYMLVCLFTLASAQRNKDLSADEVLKAMRKSTDYLANKVSLHGGYLWEYAADSSEQFGEAPARKSQIWIQGAGTPRMGETFLELYKATGDKTYLEYAKKTADALIYGQHPLGGWHYFIDFDKAGLNEWYEKVASRFLRGMEEFRHYYGNCTFDDNVTQGATTLLLHLYLETHDPVYFSALKKALDFILIAQYPNGGWPQRYPLRYEFVHDGLPDYTSNATLNDDAMNNTINLLLEAYEDLGNEEYLEAARRGGDFFIVAQGPTESPAWSEQYDRNNQPAWARTHEPPAYGTRQTAHTLEMLMKLYLFTGDRRYLRPVPATLIWMESSKIKVLENGQYEMARYYHPQTNLPIDFEILEKRTPEGYMTFRYFPSSEKPFSGRKANVDYDNLKKEYTLISGLKPGEERKLYNQRYMRPKLYGNPDKSKVAQLINTQNKDGVWMEDLSVMDVTKTMMYEGPESKKLMRGFSTRTYMENMNTFLGYILHAKQIKTY